MFYFFQMHKYIPVNSAKGSQISYYVRFHWFHLRQIPTSFTDTVEESIKIETYPCPWAVYLGVPLLAVQAHLDALTQEETRPHDDVEHRTLPLVIHGDVEHH